MKRRILSILLAAALLCALLPAAGLTAGAEIILPPDPFDDVVSGVCGSLTWELNKTNGVLTITGTGEMPDHPWTAYSGSIRTVTVGGGVTNLCDGAFQFCTRLTTVTISSSVTSIGNSAFVGCIGLTGVTIPDGVTSIGKDAFNGCEKLNSITIPDSVTSLGDWAFYNCTGLTSATIGSGLTGIGLYVFAYCGALISVTIPESVASIGQAAFLNCYKLTDVFYGGIEAKWNKITVGEMNEWLTGAEIHCIPCVHPHTHPEHADAACNEPGYDRTVCDDCGQTVSETVIPARGHELVTDAAVAATCTEPGLTAGERCMRCNYAVAQEIVPALGHELRTDVVAPTCTERGYTLTACVREGCGYTEKSAWTDALGHNYVNGFCARCGEKDPDAPLSFSDVTEADWYYGAVMFAAENELMNGVGGGRFAPDRPMTRAMLVTVLWRYEGSPAGGFNRFNDVPDDAWFTDAVSWAAENRIVNGVGDGSFEPDTTITREQMAAILFRYAQKKNYDVSARGDLNGFPDARKVQSYARDAIAWAVGAELISGTVLNGKTLLDPQGSATRAQVATILMRFIVNIANK